jgi:hypothetical protein
MNEAVVNTALLIGAILLAVAILAVLISAVVQMINNPTRAKYTLIGIGGLLLIVAIGYVLSSDEVLLRWQQFGITPSESRWVGAGLISLYILISIAVIGMIVSEIMAAFKK